MDDEEAIKKVFATYVETWNEHDMNAWGKLFTEDADFVGWSGGWRKSNKENVESHQRAHDALKEQKQKMTYKLTLAKISLLKPDTALVHANWEWPGFTSPLGDEDRKGIITMVLVKQDGRWLIRASQNTRTDIPKMTKQPEMGA